MKTKTKKKVVLGLLCFLCVAALIMFTACQINNDKDDDNDNSAVSIIISEDFSDGYVFEYTGGTIELPYGIACNAAGNHISIDLIYKILDKDEIELFSSMDTNFTLGMGEYTAKYIFGQLVKNIKFSIVDTTKPVIRFTQTSVGSMTFNTGGTAKTVLPLYEIVDYSDCDVTQTLSFYGDDGEIIEDYPVNPMNDLVESDKSGTFVFTVTAIDSSENTTEKSVSWRAKNTEWIPATAPTDNFYSDFNSPQYLDCVQNGEVSVALNSNNGNYFTEYLEEFEGATGVVKISTAFNSIGYSALRLKLGKPLALGANKNQNKYLVVRMYLPDAEAIGGDFQVAGNTISDHAFSGVIEQHALTRQYKTGVVEKSGVVSGRWLNIGIPVDLLITLQCGKGVEFVPLPAGEDLLSANKRGGYDVVTGTNEGDMEYLQFVFRLYESARYYDMYIDSITLCECADAPTGFTADTAEKTIAWTPIAGADYYNVYDENNDLIASVDTALFDASLLGNFESLSFVAVVPGKMDSAPAVIKYIDLDINFGLDGSWQRKVYLIPTAVQTNGTDLVITFNKDLPESGVINPGDCVVTSKDGQPVPLRATLDSANRNKLIIDSSYWPSSALYDVGIVTIENGSILKIGDVDFCFDEDLLFADIFGAWNIITKEDTVERINPNYGNANNHNLLMFMYDEDDKRISGEEADVSHRFNAPSPSLTYDGSFTVCGLELDQAMIQYGVYDFQLHSVKNYHYYFLFLNNSFQWINLENMCKKAGMDTVVVEIKGGTRIYMKYGNGTVRSLYFPDTWTFTKKGITTFGYTAQKTEGIAERNVNYVVTFENEAGVLYGGQLVEANGIINLSAIDLGQDDIALVEGYYDFTTNERVDINSQVTKHMRLVVKFNNN